MAAKNNNSQASSKHFTLARMRKVILIVILMFFFAGIAVFAAGWVALHSGSGEIQDEKLRAPVSTLTVTDASGQAMRLSDRQSLQGSVPVSLRDAFVAIEDKRFYSHHGVDYRRILGAAWNNMTKGTKQGASTITQQLVKNTHLSAEQTLSRKWKEAKMAIELERMYSKDEILSMYLDVLYFGSGEYGVVNASKRFFDKSPQELHVAECAMLAGIVKSPTKYNPLHHPDAANARKEVVLRCMYDQGKLTQSQYQEALAYPCRITDTKAVVPYRGYLDQAITQAANILHMDAKTFAYGGYTIQTYMQPEMQQAAHRVVHDEVFRKIGSDTIDSTRLAMWTDTATRGVVAYECNRDIDVWELRRQPASLIKPIAVYAPALDIGTIGVSSPILDEKKTFSDYAPENFRNRYYGWTDTRTALAHSLNVPAVEILSKIGLPTSLQYLSEMGIQYSDADEHLALALGGMQYGTTFPELAGAYTALANMGAYQPVSFVSTITDADGQVVYRHSDTAAKQVFSSAGAYLTTDILRTCVQEGTASKLRSLPYDIAAKTGTNSDADARWNKDAYCVAYSTQFCGITWFGNVSDTDEPLPATLTGGGMPTLMMKELAQTFYTHKTDRPFVIPTEVTEYELDRYSYDQEHCEVLADPNAPTACKIRTIGNRVYLPTAQNWAYTLIPTPNCTLFPQADGTQLLTIFADPRLSYRVTERSLGSESTIGTFTGESQYSIPLTADAGLFGISYSILPYYTDDTGQEIIGQPTVLRQAGKLW